jgi:hypothetical protein
MINRAKMPRQMYGLGSLVKDRIRKLIPNELASVASKAAPIVAPFNPAVAGLMRGIGRFDQRGSISDALKQGVGTFGLGVGARFLGGQRGMENLTGGFTRDSFTSPLSLETTDTGLLDPDVARDIAKDPTNMLPQIPEKKSLISVARDLARAGIKKLPDGVVAQLTAGGISAGASLLASYFQGEFEEPEEGETPEQYMERRREYVGQQMRVYMDNYFANDPEYMKLDEAGKNALVARYNLNKGGMPTGIMRANKAGVIERDYRDKGGFVPVGIKEKADDVPAMLSKNEFVFTADAVRGAGGGSIEKGAQKMYDTMKRLEKRVV